MNSSTKYFDPETLALIRPLGLRVRAVVEGLTAGLHHSRQRGQSLEFAQHREYVPGDDLRQVDWKVFARTDKHYVRQFEDETNLTAMVLLDRSRSMDYQGPRGGLSKLEYAQLIACSLIYLIIAQQDSVGLATFTTDLQDWLRPSSSPVQVDNAIGLLEQPSANERSSNVSRVLQQCADRLTKPSLIILISDLLDNLPGILKALNILRLAGHEVLVLHVLDAWEIEFPFDRACSFEGLEGEMPLAVDPQLIAGAYRTAVADFCRQVELGCRQIDGDYYRLRTDQSLAVSLSRLLAQRRMRRR
ncbi:MAG: DUF58 domain-containing protein [Pirellulaceae bacterium]|nr:DUF58 domain-containing protein [Pirellulaceae bacterium]